MSTVIQSCPGCKSLILSDTDQCPECGHVFHERKNKVTTAPSPDSPETLKNASLTEPCPHCGETVRSGLVRCWSCNGFMREDIAAKFRDLTSNPQKIVYSTIPLEERTDFLPPRKDAVHGIRQNVYDAEDFILDSGVASGTSRNYLPESAKGDKKADQKVSEAARVEPTESTAGPDKPQTTTPPTSKDSTRKESETKDKVAVNPSTGGDGSTAVNPAAGGDGKVDDLFSIALAEQREVKRRRGEKLAERQRKQMLIPCPCGAWVRVHEDQSGKTVRCRQCKQPVSIPEIRRKVEKKEEKAAAPKLSITWVNDVWFHLVSPTSLVLKPGSLIDKHTEADLGFTETGIHIVAFGGGEKKKKGLLGFGSSEKGTDRQTARKQFRDQIVATGELKSLPGADVQSISVEHVPEIRLVQPTAKAHESMFAGVPVFGEGRIALFLPIAAADGQQAFCSFTISAWRLAAERLKALFGIDPPATENGVPDSEKVDTLSCVVNQSKVESLKSLVYYQKDPAFELELTGYRCKSCGTVVSEEGRKKNKLGGANGKAIAKAKCPKCSGKMGEEPLYKIRKSAESGGPDISSTS